MPNFGMEGNLGSENFNEHPLVKSWGRGKFCGVKTSTRNLIEISLWPMLNNTFFKSDYFEVQSVLKVEITPRARVCSFQNVFKLRL